MVSFSCEICNDVIVKKKLDTHRNRCHNTAFTCLDCSTTFQGTSYKSHTSCISEAQKYQKSLFKPEKGKAKNGQNQNRQQNGNNGSRTNHQHSQISRAGRYTTSRQFNGGNLNDPSNPNLTPLGGRRNEIPASAEETELTNGTQSVNRNSNSGVAQDVLSQLNSSGKRKHEESSVEESKAQNGAGKEPKRKKPKSSSSEPSKKPKPASYQSTQDQLETFLASITTTKPIKISKVLKALKKEEGVTQEEALDAFKNVKLRRNEAGQIILDLR